MHYKSYLFFTVNKNNHTINTHLFSLHKHINYQLNLLRCIISRDQGKNVHVKLAIMVEYRFHDNAINADARPHPEIEEKSTSYYSV